MPSREQQGQSDPSRTEQEVIDLRLVTLAVAGDQHAFDELFRRHAKLARRVAWSVLHDDAEADDVVADAFERLLRTVPTDRLHDRRAFRAYLLVTTRNLALNTARRRARLPLMSDDQLLDQTGDGSPLDGLVDDEESGVVRRAFAALPERWRTVLWLTEVEGLSHREAGELLGATTNAVAQLAVRARAGLRETFLQAHVTGPVPEECRFTRERLAAHFAGALPMGEAAEVDQHLERCPECSVHFIELRELAGSLRHAALPIAVVLGTASLARGSMELLRPTRIAFRIAQGVAVAAAVGGLVLGSLVQLRTPDSAVVPVITAAPAVLRPVATSLPAPRVTTTPPPTAPATLVPTTITPPTTPLVAVTAPDDDLQDLEDKEKKDKKTKEDRRTGHRGRGIGPAPACHPRVARPHGGQIC